MGNNPCTATSGQISLDGIELTDERKTDPENTDIDQ